MVRPTPLVTPTLSRCLHTASSDEAKVPETHARSQTRALCCTVRRTRASLRIEETRAWCELFEASRAMLLKGRCRPSGFADDRRGKIEQVHSTPRYHVLSARKPQQTTPHAALPASLPSARGRLRRSGRSSRSSPPPAPTLQPRPYPPNDESCASDPDQRIDPPQLQQIDPAEELEYVPCVNGIDGRVQQHA
jgi:hypothetical protein